MKSWSVLSSGQCKKVNKTSCPTIKYTPVDRAQILRTRLMFKMYIYQSLQHTTAQDKETRYVFVWSSFESWNDGWSFFSHLPYIRSLESLRARFRIQWLKWPRRVPRSMSFVLYENKKSPGIPYFFSRKQFYWCRWHVTGAAHVEFWRIGRYFVLF